MVHVLLIKVVVVVAVVAAVLVAVLVITLPRRDQTKTNLVRMLSMPMVFEPTKQRPKPRLRNKWVAAEVLVAHPKQTKYETMVYGKPANRISGHHVNHYIVIGLHRKFG